MSWQFWVDVGGTFTDLLAVSPSGQIRRHKVLSSATVKGACQRAGAASVTDAARGHEPNDLWQGYTFRLLSADGQLNFVAQVRSSNGGSGALGLTSNLPAASVPVQAGPLQVGPLAYELVSPEEAPILAIRQLLGLRLKDAIPPCQVRLGTTRGTNVLLTRTGARTLFVTTRGFGDALAIGYQNRPRLFDLDIRKPEALFAATIEVDERLSASGEVLRTPNWDALCQQLQAHKQAGLESVAICFMHAYRFPQHEQRVAQLAEEAGFRVISQSHEVSPLIKLVARGDTTVLDAYLSPVLGAYVASLRHSLGKNELHLMTSAGGLVESQHFRGRDSVLSGPAGGVVGFAQVAKASGFSRSIGFDMGGTSTDVSRFDGDYTYEFESQKAGVRIVTPMLAIETVAAGGGSICGFDGVKITVGPQSAGADPGPACYGRGGPLTVTDVNVLLGRLPPDRFPFPLNAKAAQHRLHEICAAVNAATGSNYAPLKLANGFLKVANAAMSRAIRSVSVAKGADPREYLLVAFGGAAGQHACQMARDLQMQQVLCHPDAGVLSAYGMGLADITRHRAHGIYRLLSGIAPPELEAIFAQLACDARQELQQEGVPLARITCERSLEMRYRGVDAALRVENPQLGSGNFDQIQATFEAAHQRLFGYLQKNKPLEIATARVIARGVSGQQLQASHPLPAEHALAADASRQATAYFDGLPQQTPVYVREELRPGQFVLGPAIIAERLATTVIEPNWRADVQSGGELLLTDLRPEASARLSAENDPVSLEIFNHLFTGIAEQMGHTLRNTAGSVNVKERLDFSCALFTRGGDLVVNAPHIPVHLGAMGETVRAILADNPAMQPGDVFVTNDPFRGGSHLPDITVVTPVFDEATGELQFFTANRAHHAEIGGSQAGSMPPFSRCLAEEGVLLRNVRLIAAGEDCFDQVETLLRSGLYPSRAVAENLADLRAQVAANQVGADQLRQLVARHSWPVVSAYMRHIQSAAEQKTRLALARLPQGKYAFTDHMDDGARISVCITVDGDQATVDFTGTSAVHPGNLNANRAIVTAAVLYVLRCLIAEEIPLNQGVLAPITLIIPEGMLNPRGAADPRDCPAVAGGNVETSQRVVDVLLGAFGLAAASQGTMNNLLFGNQHFGYYETICGGAGGTPTAAGTSCVHTHMTNTRITDPEILETRYPVRLREFSIRHGSGGAGLHPGGDGVVRELEFLDHLSVCLVTQRRGPYPPYGLQGGEPGDLGTNTLFRHGQASEHLHGLHVLQVQPGDIVRIETPGGGGWGRQSHE